MKYIANATLTTYVNIGGNDVSMGVKAINIGVNEEKIKKSLDEVWTKMEKV